MLLVLLWSIDILYCVFPFFSFEVSLMDAEEEAIEVEKIVTATKKGAAVLDQWLPDHIKMQYHVLELASLLALEILTLSSSLLCCCQ